MTHPRPHSDIVVDCSDPELSAFWAALLERPASPRNGPYIALARANEHDIGIGFQAVPEPKESKKNRVHFDISSPDIVATKARSRLSVEPSPRPCAV